MSEPEKASSNASASNAPDETLVTPSSALLWLTLGATPGAFMLETALRKLLFPPEMDTLRTLLEPFLSPLAWVLLPVVLLASWAGLSLQERMLKRRLETMDAAPLAMRHAAAVGVFMLTASVPQIPVLVSTLTFMFGASLWPVLIAMLVGTAGVGLQAKRVQSLAST